MKQLFLSALILVSGCATGIGSHNPEALQSYGFASHPPIEVRVCVYLDEGVTRERAEELLAAWNEEEGPKYNLYMQPVTFTHKTRQGTFFAALKEETKQLPLPPQCDRALWFIGRNLSDYSYGLLTALLPVPEILGYVEGETLTRGYVVAKMGSVSQVISSPPKDVTIHEIYHLLGCQHDNMEKCYYQINELKTTFLSLKASGYYTRIGEPDFFPTYVAGGKVILVTHKQISKPLGFTGHGVHGSQ